MNPKQTMPFQDEPSNFHLGEWIEKSKRYWYLFVVASIIAVGFIVFTNLQWTPTYKVAGRLMVNYNQQKNTLPNSNTNPFDYNGVAAQREINNQLILMTSYDFLSRVVDSLPDLLVEYSEQKKLKNYDLYKRSPINVMDYQITDKAAYNQSFSCVAVGENQVQIENEDKSFQQVVELDKPFETPYFKATITQKAPFEKVSFHFNDKEILIQTLTKRLKMNAVMNNSAAIDVFLSTNSLQKGYDIINTILRLVQITNIERKNKMANSSIDFINSQLQLLSHDLQQSENSLTNFHSQNKILDPTNYGSALTQRLAQYEQDLALSQLKENYLNYLSDYLQQSIATESVASPFALGLTDGALTSYVQQLNTLQLQRAELSEQNIYYAKYTTDIENVKKTIAEVIKSMRSTLGIEKQNLQNNITQLEKQIKDLPQKEMRISSIQRDYRVSDTYYTFFLQKRAEAEIQRASNTSDHEILEYAHVLSVTNKYRKTNTLILCLLLALLVPFGMVVLLEKTNNRFRDEKDVKSVVDYPLLSFLSHLRSNNPTIALAKPRSAYAEQLRVIRNKVEFILKRKTDMLIAITSTQSGDGKTFFSTNLATIYAMSGKKTLLVDMDIRKPSIHGVLQIPKQKGLSNYLIHDCGLDEIIIKDDRYPFDFIQAGAIPPNPGEMIRSDEMEAFLQSVRKMYDFVIVDTSPIGMVPDASFVVANTDITLYVIRQMKTDKQFCLNVLEQLHENYKDKIYLILSDVDKKNQQEYTYGMGVKPTWWQQLKAKITHQETANPYYTEEE